MKIKDLILGLISIIIFCCLCWFVVCDRVFGQTFTQTQLIQKMATVKVGDLLSRSGNVEKRKASLDGKITAKVYSSPQWDANGQPLLKYSDLTGKVTSRGRYVKYIPDVDTAKLKVTRTIGNSIIKEYWTVPNETVTKLTWTVETDAWYVGFGNEILIFYDTVNEELFRMQPPIAWDAAKKSVGVNVTYKTGVLTYTIVGEGYEYPIIVDPTTTASLYATESGYGRSFGIDTYLNKRNVSSGDGNFKESTTFIGQNFTGGDTYWIIRSFMSFPIGSLGVCDACTLYIDGSTDFSNTDFNVNIFGARSYKSVLANADFSNFDGWVASGAYTGTALNNTWNTASYSANWNTFVFNAAGRDSVQEAFGDTLWVALLSSRDVAATAPTGDERIEITRTGVSAPYLSITSTPLSAVLPRSITQFGRPTPFRTETGITVLKQP